MAAVNTPIGGYDSELLVEPAAVFPGTYEFDEDIEGETQAVVFGTRVPYSHYHQYGTERLPKREHVGIDKTALDSLVEQAAERAVQIISEVL